MPVQLSSGLNKAPTSGIRNLGILLEHQSIRLGSTFLLQIFFIVLSLSSEGVESLRIGWIASVFHSTYNLVKGPISATSPGYRNRVSTTYKNSFWSPCQFYVSQHGETVVFFSLLLSRNILKLTVPTFFQIQKQSAPLILYRWKETQNILNEGKKRSSQLNLVGNMEYGTVSYYTYNYYINCREHDHQHKEFSRLPCSKPYTYRLSNIILVLKKKKQEKAIY